MLQQVHIDVWGPVHVASLGCLYYNVIFIDDFTRNLWVYFMKNKYEVFSIFNRWKAMVEIETNLKLKCIRYDNCVDNGIMIVKTIHTTLQQNGIA